MILTLPPKPAPPVSFAHVFGEGNEKNWEVFQKLFSTAFSEEVRTSFLERAKQKNDLSFRLIKEGEDSIGIVIYVRKPFTSYQVFGFGYTLLVKALHVPQFNRAVRQVLIQTAIEMKATSIVVHALKSDNDLKQALVERSFRKIEAAQSDLWELFGYDQRKKEGEPPQEGSADATKKRERADDRLQEGNGDPSVKELKVENPQ